MRIKVIIAIVISFMLFLSGCILLPKRDNNADLYPYILQDKNGNYWVVWESMGNDNPVKIFYSNSKDGINWSEPIFLINYNNAISDFIQDNNGRYIIVFNNFHVITSKDGIKWSEPIRLGIEQKVEHAYYHPSLSQTKDGRYFCIWQLKDGFYISSSNDMNLWEYPTKLFSTNGTIYTKNPKVFEDSNGTLRIKAPTQKLLSSIDGKNWSIKSIDYGGEIIGKIDMEFIISASAIKGERVINFLSTKDFENTTLIASFDEEKIAPFVNAQMYIISSDKKYFVAFDNSNRIESFDGDFDIFISYSIDGYNWSTPIKIS